MAYNRIYTKEKWDKVNIFNKNLVDDYINECKAEGKSEGTVKQYFNDARIILIYILEVLQNKGLNELTKKNFRNFTLWLQENGLSPARINRLLVTSRNLLNFGAEDEDYEDDFVNTKLNPSRIKGLKRREVREIVFLEDNEVELIFNELINQGKYSQAFLCALMYDSACRRNEAYQVKMDDFDLDSKIPFTKRKVTGKRGKTFKLMFNERTKKAYKLLSENTPAKELNTPFLTDENTPASYMTLYNWVISWQKILFEKTGVMKNFNPHSFRHSALENLKRGSHYIAREMGKQFDLKELKSLAHHKSVDTTEGYLKNDEEDLLLKAFGIMEEEQD